MFFRQRATQAEYFDLPTRTQQEVAEGFRELARINRWFLFADPFQRMIPATLGTERCRALKILDLGAGDGSLGRTLESWAGRQGWEWRITNLDMNAHALRLRAGGRNVAALATALPFADRSFDVVIASQMTHHLANDEDACRHFREAWRVCGDLLLLNDLHRNLALYCVIGCVLHLLGFSKRFREDGLLSVRRAWRLPEWRELAARAGISQGEVFLYYGSRIHLRARHGGARLIPSASTDQRPVKPGS